MEKKLSNLSNLAIYLEIDTDKVLGNGVLVQTFRKIKAIADALHFVCIEPNIWEYHGDDNDFVAFGKFNSSIVQLGVIDKLETYLVHFETGEIEDALEAYRKSNEKARKAGWIGPDGKIMSIRKERELRKKGIIK